nr:MAG TPA: hypothetical protein [Caudoviricetes sp.]
MLFALVRAISLLRLLSLRPWLYDLVRTFCGLFRPATGPKKGIKTGTQHTTKAPHIKPHR